MIWGAGSIKQNAPRARCEMIIIEASGSLIKSLTPPFQSDKVLLEFESQIGKGILIHEIKF